MSPRIAAVWPVALACGLFLSGAAARGDELSTGDLLALCRDPDQLKQTACHFFVSGAVRGLTLGDGTVMHKGKMIERGNTHFCAPENMASATMVAVFQRAATQLAQVYPGDLKFSAVTVILAAFNRAYPCPD